MADNLFNYATSNRGVMNTGAFNVQQNPVKGAGAEITRLLQAGASAYVEYEEQQKKNSLKETSRSLNEINNYYLQEKAKTQDPIAHKELYDNYVNAVNYLNSNLEDDDLKFEFEQSTQGFVNREGASVQKGLTDFQLNNISNEFTETVVAMKDSTVEGFSKLLTRYKEQFTTILPDDKTINSKMIAMVGNALIATNLNSSDVNLDTVKGIKDTLEGLNKTFDNGKSTGKDEYERVIGSLNKLLKTSSDSLAENVRVFENSLEFKNGYIDPEEYNKFLGANKDSKQRSKYEAYKQKYTFINSFDPKRNQLTQIPQEYREDVRRRVNLDLNQMFKSGNYIDALAVVQNTGEVGTIKSSLSVALNSNNPEELQQTALLLNKMMNTNRPVVVDKLLNVTDRATAVYLEHLIETKASITEADVEFINRSQATQGEVYLSKDMDKELKETFGADFDYPETRELALSLKRLRVPDEKILEHIEQYKESTTIKPGLLSVGSKIDISGTGGMDISQDPDENTKAIERVFEPLFKDFSKIYGKDMGFKYNKNTGTFWITSEEGIPQQDILLTRDEVMDIMKVNAQMDIMEKETSSNAYGEDDMVFVETMSPAMIVTDMYDKAKGGFKNMLEMLFGFNEDLVTQQSLTPKSAIERKVKKELKLPETILNLRNVRNNNLGNIKHNKNNDWQGQTAEQKDKTFVSFDTPEMGVRAFVKVANANLNATNTFEEYVNRYASEPNEQAYFKANGKLMPHLQNYAAMLAKSQGMSDIKADHGKSVDMVEWIKATAIAEGNKDALEYFTDDVIIRGIKLSK